MPIKEYPAKEIDALRGVSEPTKEVGGHWEIQGASMWGVADKHMTLFTDFDRCIGCFTCEVACKLEHDLPAGPRFIQVMQLGPHKIGDTIKTYYFPMYCFNCGRAPCIPACPVDAISRRADGIVLIDPEKCIGCKLCIEACPFGAPQLDTRTGKVFKCDSCKDRVDKGLWPACATKCAMKAMYFGDVNEITTLIREKRARKMAQGLFREAVYSGPSAVWPERLKYLPTKTTIPLKEAVSPHIASK